MRRPREFVLPPIWTIAAVMGVGAGIWVAIIYGALRATGACS
ncbi:MAG: hypothetical protein ACYC0B_01955 [Gemmatimonadaceae bacterium]